MTAHQKFDVIIIGGSYAGLSAAMALGRSLRKVLLIDSGKPCNRFTPHSQNFITHDGAEPGAIAALAKEQVLQYDTVQFHIDKAVTAQKIANGFAITTETGTTFTAKKLILATGVKDIFPHITHFEACWGKTVIHCPYCHGYEFRGQKTAILANGERALHLAALVKNLTQDLTIITRGKADFTDEQWSKLKKNNIPVIEKEVNKIEHQNGQMTALLFEDGTKENFVASYAVIPFEQHSDLAKTLGCEFTETGHLKVDQFQKTSIPDVFACGDATVPMRSVANAVSTGNIAGAIVNMTLTQEEF